MPAGAAGHLSTALHCTQHLLEGFTKEEAGGAQGSAEGESQEQTVGATAYSPALQDSCIKKGMHCKKVRRGCMVTALVPAPTDKER